MRDGTHRLCGLAMLLASGVTTTVHRTVYEAGRHGPAGVVEFALGLATFVLACTGVLLLVHGARLLRRDGGEAAAAGRDLRSRLTDPIGQAGRVFDTRRGADMVKQRRIAASMARAEGHGVEARDRPIASRR